MRHLSIFAVFALAGCSAATSPFTNEDPAQVQSALDSQNGGMTTSTESPAFSDPAVQAVEGFIPDLGDTQDFTTEAAQVQGAQRFHLAVVWGHLPPAHDADATDAIPSIMDWTGSISVDAASFRAATGFEHQHDERETIESYRAVL